MTESVFIVAALLSATAFMVLGGFFHWTVVSLQQAQEKTRTLWAAETAYLKAQNQVLWSRIEKLQATITAVDVTSKASLDDSYKPLAAGLASDVARLRTHWHEVGLPVSVVEKQLDVHTPPPVPKSEPWVDGDVSDLFAP